MTDNKANSITLNNTRTLTTDIVKACRASGTKESVVRKVLVNASNVRNQQLADQYAIHPTAAMPTLYQCQYLNACREQLSNQQADTTLFPTESQATLYMLHVALTRLVEMGAVEDFRDEFEDKLLAAGYSESVLEEANDTLIKTILPYLIGTLEQNNYVIDWIMGFDDDGELQESWYDISPVDTAALLQRSQESFTAMSRW